MARPVSPTTSVRNRKDLEALTPKQRQERAAALQAVSMMRDDPTLSLSRAARQAGTTPRSVRHYAGDALEHSGSRWTATRADRLYRPMFVNSGGLVVPVDVRGSRKASEVSAYHRAVRRYLDSGDDRDLNRFASRTVAGVEYETDPDVLDEMARRGQLSIESIYQAVA